MKVDAGSKWLEGLAVAHCSLGFTGFRDQGFGSRV